MRLPALLLVAGQPAGALPSAALGSCTTGHPTQGDSYRGAGNDNGTRAFIQGSATNNSCGGVLASVSLQSAPPNASSGGFIQTGYLMETSTFASDCDPSGTTGAIAVVTEWASISNPTNLQCDQFVGGQKDLFGEGDTFAAALGTNGWETFWDSIQEYTITGLGYNSGYSVARGEAKYYSTQPSFNVTWGPSGQEEWEYKTNSSGCCQTYTPVGNNATPYSYPSGYWSVGTPPAGGGPFSIRFVG